MVKLKKVASWTTGSLGIRGDLGWQQNDTSSQQEGSWIEERICCVSKKSL